jgi:glutamate dehydrogenase (NAD(P)+)
MSVLMTSTALAVAELTLPDTGVEAWIVVDSLVDGIAIGGTRTSDELNEAELRELARAMTVKLGLVGLRAGGAKAGIRYCPGPGRPERADVLRDFGRVAAPGLHGGVYLGADLGTTHADRDVFFTAAGYDPLSRPGVSRVAVGWDRLWARLANVTGQGVVVGAMSALRADRRTGPQRVVVQGFGNVGRNAALAMFDAGHRIVAIADSHGTVQDPRGLDVASLSVRSA